ncbi:cbb3-type cytochrome oxidase assembly protein CcoS [Flavobacterium sp. SOK18b]|uniref:cbb3-type cytochrome oxidase assembly protein CcoS n=2 Tax=unclassified Flavobacterium TaxID=196869 RepID=UPI0015F8F039|nr:cbb3-type cytochrome oxidase assembly protein CcoS [Flavobacterium sp. SOK18b]MBB1194661.1 cbb3-type cytochrome oxidase assembly protein CcoS [Flavobacterium sp. SOK18b]
MSVIYLLISISILVAIGFFIAFIRAVKTGQYDDDYTPSVRMLFEDELIQKEIKNKEEPLKIENLETQKNNQ